MRFPPTLLLYTNGIEKLQVTQESGTIAQLGVL